MAGNHKGCPYFARRRCAMYNSRSYNSLGYNTP